MSKLYLYFSPTNESTQNVFNLYICHEAHKANKIVPRAEVYQTILDVTGSSEFQINWVPAINKARVDYLTTQLNPIIDGFKKKGYRAVISMNGNRFSFTVFDETPIREIPEKSNESKVSTTMTNKDSISVILENLMKKHNICFDALTMHATQARFMTPKEVEQSEAKYQKKLKDAIAAMKPLNSGYSIKVTGMLERSDELPSAMTHKLSVEEAVAAIAVIEGHRINTKPVMLTAHTKKGNYFFNTPQVDISASHLPHHTAEGDIFEISDLKTREAYKITISREFLNLCYYTRPNSFMSDAYNVEIIKAALEMSKAEHDKIKEHRMAIAKILPQNSRKYLEKNGISKHQAILFYQSELRVEMERQVNIDKQKILMEMKAEVAAQKDNDSASRNGLFKTKEMTLKYFERYLEVSLPATEKEGMPLKKR